MYLSHLRLWNFRKFGCGNNELDLDKPDLHVPFKMGTNVLIGENDSGKTAIIDAIKLVLRTHSREGLWPNTDDFYEDSVRFRIECRFDNMSNDEAKNFVEWLGMEGEGKFAKPYLKANLDVSRTGDRILPSEVKAGVDSEGHQLTAEAREYLKVAFLRPLRNAERELVARKNSRLSQIFAGHEAFKGKEIGHHLVDIFSRLNKNIELYFEAKTETDEGVEQNINDESGKDLKEEIDKYLESFCDMKSVLEVSGGELRKILEALSLTLHDKNVGLGTYNRLFIAAELLHLHKKDWCGLRLGLIEELEAHLHPQAQLRVIESLQKQENVQLILTTHSPNLGSKVKLDNLIICVGNDVFPMGSKYTKLRGTDYAFLERFLDVTKANLFFAKGVILVEGWAEEMILPVLAKLVGYDLSRSGVSVVNIGNIAFLRYSKIFQRMHGTEMPMPVAVITDLDKEPDEYSEMSPEEKRTHDERKRKYDGQRVKTFVSLHWTLEYCIASCTTLQIMFYKAVLKALKEMIQDKGVSNLSKYNKAIDDVDTHFGYWEDEDIALRICWQILGKDKILDLHKGRVSKAIIAQHFAEELSELRSSREIQDTLMAEDGISYLVKAIAYASGTDSYI